MKIIIHAGEDGVNKVTFEDVKTEDKVTYDDLLAVFLSVLESATQQLLKETDADKEDREHLYDVLDSLFFAFMLRTFPDIQPRDFDFSDAAMLYAQDQIIEEAEKEGLTFEEAMEKYEARAKAYVKATARPM